MSLFVYFAQKPSVMGYYLIKLQHISSNTYQYL